jgi:S-DNA-T family DNA segregation ATPase FtsK/SpoIIIE
MRTRAMVRAAQKERNELHEYIKRIETVMSLRCPDGKVKRGKEYVGTPWKLIDTRDTGNCIEIAFETPYGYSAKDLRQETDSLFAAVGARVEIKDRAGAVIVRIIKKDFPDLLKYLDVLKILPNGTRQVLLGVDANGDPIIHDFRIPHILICGMSGYGKTDFIRWILWQLMLRNHPDFFEYHVIDLKGFSFMPFVGVRHMTRIALDLASAADVLKDAFQEMERRSKMVWEAQNRNMTKSFIWRMIVIDEASRLKPEYYPIGSRERKIASSCWNYMSQISCVGREAGIGLMFCTQYPSRDVIHGQIKANMDAVICFKTLNGIHSDVAIDSPLAASLPTGRPGLSIIKRSQETIQTPYVGNDDVWKLMLSPFKEAAHEKTEPDEPTNLKDFE